MKTGRRVSRRRKWKRFIVKGGAIVLLHPADLKSLITVWPIELGPIINIGLGGAMVQYFDSKDRQRQCDTLSIVGKQEELKVEKIPFETIADFEVANLPDGKVIRNRSVRFGKLTSLQSFQLETFIKTYGVKDAPDRRRGKDRRLREDPRFQDPEFSIVHDRRSGKDRRR